MNLFLQLEALETDTRGEEENCNKNKKICFSAYAIVCLAFISRKYKYEYSYGKGEEKKMIIKRYTQATYKIYWPINWN